MSLKHPRLACWVTPTGSVVRSTKPSKSSAYLLGCHVI